MPHSQAGALRQRSGQAWERVNQVVLGSGKEIRPCLSSQTTSKQLMAETPTSEALSINQSISSLHSALSAVVSSFTHHSQI